MYVCCEEMWTGAGRVGGAGTVGGAGRVGGAVFLFSQLDCAGCSDTHPGLVLV